MTWLWLTPLLALVVTWVLGRYNARAIERDWEMMLTAKGRGAIEALELQVLCDGAAVESARIGALSARERADFPQATRLAGLAYRAVEEATPDRLKRLRAMGVCIRMATAILPVPALKPRNFRLTQLASLAGLSKFIHHVLASTGERFLLRLYVLGLGYRIITRSLSGSSASVKNDVGDVWAWDIFDRATADWSTLEREHVESFRVFVLSLTAEKRTLESGA
jgi:hypothetical protein